jgi:hypothetical protein
LRRNVPGFGRLAIELRGGEIVLDDTIALRKLHAAQKVTFRFFLATLFRRRI